MPEIAKLPAVRKQRSGTGSARASRRAGMVPGVLYGDDKEPEMIQINAKDLSQEMVRGRLSARLVEIVIDGDGQWALLRGLQRDPLSSQPIHADFQRVRPDTKITVQVPVEFVNEASSPGLRRGGVLNVVRHTVEIRCTAGNIPDRLQANLAKLGINASIHISAIALPENVLPTITDRDFTIATIAVPSGLRGQMSSDAESAADNT